MPCSMMEQDSKRSMLQQATQISAVALTVWQLLSGINSTSIRLIGIRCSFFAEDAQTGSKVFINSDIGINEVIPIL